MTVQGVTFRFRAVSRFLKLHMPINVCHLRYHEILLNYLLFHMHMI